MLKCVDSDESVIMEQLQEKQVENPIFENSSNGDNSVRKKLLDKKEKEEVH